MNIFSAEQLKFILVKKKGNSFFTVKSNETDKDYTFKISTSVFNNKVYHHVYVETRYLDFKYLGYYFNGRIIQKKKTNDSDSAIALSWLLRQTEKGNYTFLDDKVTLYHLGKCLCCNRTLTDKVSIEFGVGPYCRTKK